MKPARIAGVEIGGPEPEPVFIAGPCAIESEGSVREIAGFLAGLRSRGAKIVMKLSYDKPNRTSADSYRGPGIKEGLKIIRDVRREWNLPVLVDIHSSEEASQAAREADCLQIPAFLCRQTPLLEAAGKTGLPVNIKKGQFMSPRAMGYQAEKAVKAGAPGIIFTERGFSFGYGDLVVDMRSIVVMKGFGYPVLFDATHSQQSPPSGGAETGGNRQFILPLALAARAAGANGIYCEVHPNPQEAESDRSTQLSFGEFEVLVNEVSMLQSR